MAEETVLGANGASLESGRGQFAKARRRGYPAWLWPDVPVENWRSAVDAIVDVARKVLAGEPKPSLLGSDAKALGLAGYTSGMGPLLGFWLESGMVSAEAEIAELFTHHLSHNRRRMNRLLEVVCEAIRQLNNTNVSPLILKGMHTAFRYFPEPGTRPLSDIDMYIPMESMLTTERVLADLGYRRVPRMRSPYACDWIDPSQSQDPRTLTFVHEDDPWSIDVVGTLDKRLSTGKHIRFTNLLPCSEPADWFSAARASVMRQPLLVLYLAVHVSQTLLNVTTLRVLELVLVIRRDSARRELDWDEFLRGAHLMGGPRLVYPALAFAAELAPNTVPVDVMAAVTTDASRNLRSVVERLTISSAQPLDRHSLSERFMWARTGGEYLTQIAGELFIDGQGRPLDRALYGIGTKLWAFGRGRYSP